MIVGSKFTVTDAVFVSVHPRIVPVTVYEVVVEGVTLILEAVAAVFQL